MTGDPHQVARDPHQVAGNPHQLAGDPRQAAPVDEGLLAYTIPDMPNHPDQRYALSEEP